MEDAITEATTSAWDELGIAAALFFVLVLLIVGGYKLAMKYMDTYGAKRKAEKSTPKPSPERAPSKTWWEGMSANMIKAEKAKADETQDERLNRIEERIDEVFKVEGKHRQEILDALKEVKGILEKHRDKSDAKNDKQDALIHGLSTSFATLQGMVAARRATGASGVTQFTSYPDAQPTKDPKGNE